MRCRAAHEQANNFLDDAVNDGNAMPSPPEDREIEELLSYLGTDGTHSLGGQTYSTFLNDGSARRPSTLDTISDDDDYDQLFMEVMADDGRTSQAGTPEREGWCEPHQDQESSMDLS
jgi:hypothetical protein